MRLRDGSPDPEKLCVRTSGSDTRLFVGLRSDETSVAASGAGNTPNLVVEGATLLLARFTRGPLRRVASSSASWRRRSSTGSAGVERRSGRNPARRRRWRLQRPCLVRLLHA
jgi:hypothetical protein